MATQITNTAVLNYRTEKKQTLKELSNKEKFAIVAKKANQEAKLYYAEIRREITEVRGGKFDADDNRIAWTFALKVAWNGSQALTQEYVTFHADWLWEEIGRPLKNYQYRVGVKNTSLYKKLYLNGK